MRSLVILLLALVHVLALPLPASAQDYTASRVLAVESWVEEWDEASQSWVRVSEPEVAVERFSARAERYALPHARPHFAAAQFDAPQLTAQPAAIIRDTDTDRFGPFRFLGNGRAALVGTTDSYAPEHFERMMRAHPGIEVLELVDAPGTRDDLANLRLGRMIRAAGLETYVPSNGSVRSGAVELFLAGTERKMADGAEFAVHSWIDNYGREPDDFAPDSPENRLYLDYYEEMGMSDERARAFYAMTNSVPHQSALWLGADDMQGWIEPEPVRARVMAEVQLAYLDVTAFDAAIITLDGLEIPAIDTIEIAPIKLARLDLAVAFP